MKEEAADISQELKVAADLADRSSKVVGLLIAILTVIAIITGGVMGLVAYIGETTAHALEAHGKAIHEDGVHRDTFDAHVEAAEKRTDRMERKLDALGEKAYGSQESWDAATK